MNVYYKIKNAALYATAKKRGKKLNNKNITIISNNCWGGMIYKTYGIKYNSPTVGCFFMTKDYIKFLANLDYYLNENLKFIDFKHSKWKGSIKENVNYPIGIIDDIEIFFVHYKSEEEALEKWNRRKKRVNKNNMVVKISEQNNFNKEDLDIFSSLSYKNKIAFVGSNYTGENVYIVDSFNTSVKELNINKEPRIKFGKLNILSYLNGIKE